MESRDVELLELIFDGIIKPRDVKFSALERITQNFSEQRIIGEGGFAKVYKGVLRNGEVAVKRIRNDQTIDEKLFQQEVRSLLNVSHKNIVRFIGFCSHTVHTAVHYEGQYIFAENRDRMLCLEYINNGSLEKYIADELRGLPWDTRVFVIKGICEGLQYLHMKKQIIHRDLKPANILIDNNMVAKITDFGLSRMEENAQTKSTTRVSSPGYTSPEYIDNGEMSVKYDVYSLGVIIIELVTGRKSIPDTNSVLRRWRHRLRKSGKETPLIYQQIAKLIEIGLLCQDKDPYKRPFISEIMDVMNELESTDWQISNANESASGQISPYLEDDMLGIEPLELCFPFKINSQLSCSIELTNKTNAFIAFSIQTTSPLPYCIQPKKDTVAPRSKYSVNITLQSLNKAPQDREYTGDFIVRSTKVNESLTGEDITEDAFNREEGKLVDEVNLTITYKAEVPQVDVSLGSQIISDTRNLHSPQESDVRPTDAESKFNELQEYYLQRRRTGAQSRRQDDVTMNREGYHEGLEDFQSVLTTFTRYSRLRVIAELRHGDLFHTANIVSSIEFDRDDELFATAGVSKRIKVFEFSTVVNEPSDVHCPVVEMATRSKLSCLSWNKYSKNIIASSDYEGIVTVWDVQTRQSVMEYEEHEKRAWSVDFSRTEPSMLVSGSDDCKVKVWCTKQEASAINIDMKANICSVKYNPGSSCFVAVGSADHHIHYFDLRNPSAPLHVFGGHKESVSYVKFLSNNELASASTDSTLRLWDVKDNCPVRTFRGHKNEKNFVGLSVNNEYIACGSETNEVFVYHKAISKPASSHRFVSSDLDDAEDDPGSYFISAVCWKSDSPTMLTANSQGTIKVLVLAP